MDMSYDNYNKHNKHAVQWKLFSMINKDENLIEKLNRNSSHPLNRNYSHVQYNI